MATLSSTLGLTEESALPSGTSQDDVDARASWMRRIINYASIAGASNVNVALSDWVGWTDLEHLCWAWGTDDGEDLIKAATDPESQFADIFSQHEQDTLDKFSQFHYEAYGAYPHQVG